MGLPTNIKSHRVAQPNARMGLLVLTAHWQSMNPSTNINIESNWGFVGVFLGASRGLPGGFLQKFHRRSTLYVLLAFKLGMYQNSNMYQGKKKVLKQEKIEVKEVAI